MVRKTATKVAPEPTPDEAQFHAIEKFVDSRESPNGQLEYLIKWKDFPESHNSWQSINDLYCKRNTSPSATPATAVNVMIILDPIDLSDEEHPKPKEPSARKKKTPMVADSNEIGTATAAPVEKEQHNDDNDHGETSPKLRPNRQASEPEPKPKGPKKSDEQQEKKQAPSKRGRPKSNENVRTEQDSIVDANQQEQPPKKRRQKRQSVPAKAHNEQNGLGDDDDAAAAAAAVNVHAERIIGIDHVEKMRKRNNRHEYLVARMDGNVEWIGRETMVRKYAPQLIAYFERITRFRTVAAATVTSP